MTPSTSLPSAGEMARDNGPSWNDIATALSTSPEQAGLRYSPDSRGRRQQMAIRRV